MGRYVTRAGVEIEMGDEAARVVGYAPAPEASPSKGGEPKAKRQRSSSDKSD